MKTARFVVALLLALYGVAQASSLESGERISLSLQSVPIAKVLGMIAAQNKLNLVISDQVEGDISLQLDNVDLRTALDAILSANGYTYIERDNVIVVTSA